MDPTATLNELLSLIKGRLRIEQFTDIEEVKFVSEEIADRVEALHGWLSKGGHLPNQWKPSRQFRPAPEVPDHLTGRDRHLAELMLAGGGDQSNGLPTREQAPLLYSLADALAAANGTAQQAAEEPTR